MKNIIISVVTLIGTTVSFAQNRVGIGISTPLYPLHLSNSTNGPISMSLSNAHTGQGIADGTQIGYLQANSNDFTLSNQENGHLTLATNLGSSYLRLTNNGRVGIGTFNPGAQLHVHENSSNPVGIFFSNTYTQNQVANALFVGYGFANQPHVDIYNYQNGDLRLGTNAGFRMIIKANGNTGVGTLQPNHRFEVEGNSHFSGNLGIFKSNPQHALDVNGDAFVSGSIRRLPTTRTITYGPAAFHSTNTSSPKDGNNLSAQSFAVNQMHNNYQSFNFLNKLTIGVNTGLISDYRVGYSGLQLFLPNSATLNKIKIKSSYNNDIQNLEGTFQIIITRTTIGLSNNSTASIYYATPSIERTANSILIYKDSQKFVAELNLAPHNLTIENEQYIYALYVRYFTGFQPFVNAIDWVQLEYETEYHSE